MNQQEIQKSMDKIVAEQRKILGRETALGKDDLTGEAAQKYQALENRWNALDEKRIPLFQQIDPSEGDHIQQRTGQIYDRRSLHELAERAANYTFDPNGSSVRDQFNLGLAGGIAAVNTEAFRALSVDGSGGQYLTIPKEVISQLIKDLDDELPFRTRTTSFVLDRAESFRAPKLDPDFGDTTWTSELRTGDEDADMDFSGRDFFPHPLARRLKVSNKLLRLSVLSPEDLVRQRMVYKIGVALENGYMNGNGTNQPLGIFVADAQGVPASRDVTSGVVGGIKADDIFDVIKELKSGYRRNAIWVMSRETESRIRKLKSGEGDYLWIPGLQFDRPATLGGFQILLSEFAPSTWSTGEYAMCLCDPKFYWTVDSLQSEIKVLDQLYAESNQTGYIVRYEGDGAPVVPEAFVRLQLG